MKARIAVVFAIVGFAFAAPAAHAADKAAEKTPLSRVKEITDDATITTKIKTEFARDKAVSALGISVDTNNGVVTLSGSAKSKEEADKAVAIARNVGGVASVKNEIKVGGAKK